MVPKRLVRFLLAVLLLALAVPGIAVAAERGIKLSTPFPDITVGGSEEIDFPIRVTNQGDAEEYLRLEVAGAPQGWKTGLLNQNWGTPMGVRGLRVLPGAAEAQTVYLRTVPPSGATGGPHSIVFKALAEDGAVEATLNLSVKLDTVEKVATQESQLLLSTFYPTQRGPSGTTFILRVDMQNTGAKDATVGLATTPFPEGWQVLFRPAYEEKLISQITVPTGGITRSVDVEVTPPQTVEAAEYPFQVQATGDGIRATLDLAVAIFGTYDVTLALPTERLNAEATAGKKSNLTLRVFNTGSAELRNISLVSNAPQGWGVSFNPETVPLLGTSQLIEVGVTLEPPDRTIAGDYGITLTASSLQAIDSLDVRVAVGSSTIWGWVGLAIVGLVIVGMAGVFVVVGRR